MWTKYRVHCRTVDHIYRKCTIYMCTILYSSRSMFRSKSIVRLQYSLYDVLNASLKSRKCIYWISSWKKNNMKKCFIVHNITMQFFLHRRRSLQRYTNIQQSECQRENQFAFIGFFNYFSVNAVFLFVCVLYVFLVKCNFPLRLLHRKPYTAPALLHSNDGMVLLYATGWHRLR